MYIYYIQLAPMFHILQYRTARSADPTGTYGPHSESPNKGIPSRLSLCPLRGHQARASQPLVASELGLARQKRLGVGG